MSVGKGIGHKFSAGTETLAGSIDSGTEGLGESLIRSIWCTLKTSSALQLGERKIIPTESSVRRDAGKACRRAG